VLETPNLYALMADKQTEHDFEVQKLLGTLLEGSVG
jgi:hypothetical protein